MLWTDHQKRPGSHISREIYRERCRDEDGNRHSVVVFEDEIGITTYRLRNGTEARFVDDCEFEIVKTARSSRAASTGAGGRHETVLALLDLFHVERGALYRDGARSYRVTARRAAPQNSTVGGSLTGNDPFPRIQTMINDKSECEAAAARANAWSDAPEGFPAAEELGTLVADLRHWDEEHKGEQSHGPETMEGLTRPDDMSISGLPFNIGKLTKD